MSEGIILGDDQRQYSGKTFSAEKRECDNCEKENNEADVEIAVPSLTDHMNFRLPKRIIPY